MIQVKRSTIVRQPILFSTYSRFLTKKFEIRTSQTSNIDLGQDQTERSRAKTNDDDRVALVGGSEGLDPLVLKTLFVGGAQGL